MVDGCWLLVVGCWLLVVGCWFFNAARFFVLSTYSSIQLAVFLTLRVFCIKYLALRAIF